MNDLIERVEAALAFDREDCGWRPIVVELLTALKETHGQLAATRTVLFGELAACENNLKTVRAENEQLRAQSVPSPRSSGCVSCDMLIPHQHPAEDRP